MDSAIPPAGGRSSLRAHWKERRSLIYKSQREQSTYELHSPPSSYTNSGGRLVLRHRYVTIVHVNHYEEILERERDIPSGESSFGKLEESEWILRS